MLTQATSADAGDQELPPPATEERLQARQASRVQVTVDLAPGMRVRVTVEALPDGRPSGEEAVGEIINQTVFASDRKITLHVPPLPGSLQTSPAQGKVLRLSWPAGLAGARQQLFAGLRSYPAGLSAALFALALGVYLLTRLAGLTQFPIYFFTDEAAQTVLAADLVRDGFRNYAKDFLPTYFQNGGKYRLGISVYLQVLPYLMFGKSVFVTRMTSVLVGLLAPLSITWALRDVYRLRNWWLGAALLSATPVWFLHSRTAFEVVEAVAFYAVFLWAYLTYRDGQIRFLYLAAAAGALAFYTYSPMQIVVPLTAALLLVSDWRFHWQNRAVLLRTLGLLALLALPYLRFVLSHRAANFTSLSAIGSYWVTDLPLAEKLSRYAVQYLHAISPLYWLSRDQGELIRHVMKGYAHLLPALLPFYAIGLWVAVKNVRRPAYRAVLIALFAAPAATALADVGVTRVLVMIIPAVLLAAFGLEKTMDWLASRHLPRAALALSVFALLCLTNLVMLRRALADAPTWFTEYGLGGMQWGAQQVFPRIQEILQRSPDTEVVLSPDWANGTDVLKRFFLADSIPVRLASIEGYMFELQPVSEEMLFVMIPEEFQKASQSGKFQDIQVESTLRYPDGREGFYFTRLRYSDDIEAILAQEREARRQLQEERILFGTGQAAQVRYSMLDMGSVQNLFDGDRETLARTLEANPMVVQMAFAEVQRFNGLTIKLGSAELLVTAQLTLPGDGQTVEYRATLKGTVDDPVGRFSFPAAVEADGLTLLLEDVHQPEPGHVHVWEIEFQ